MSEENNNIVEELKEEAINELSTLEEKDNKDNEKVIQDAKEKIKAIFYDIQICIYLLLL